jgi:mannosyltransferase
MKISYSKQELPDGYRLIALLLIIVAGFAIRLHDLDGDSLWIDEILTVQYAEAGIEGIQSDPHHPPLYYALAAAALNFFGEEEFAVRIPSAMSGTLAIAAIALLGRIIGAPGAGLWAALLLALSPFHIRYSQEARQYALLLLLSLLSYCFLYRALLRPKWSSWLAYSAFATLSLYTHFGGLIVLLSQSVLIAFWSLKRLLNRQARDISYPVVALGLSLVLFVPWVPRFIAALEFNVGSETISDTGSMAPLQSWLQVAYRDFGMVSDIFAPLLLGLCLLGLVYWLLEKEWLKLGLILSGLVLPLILIILFQVARGAFARFIIYMLPFYLLAAGYAIDRSLLFSRQFTGRTINRAIGAIIVLGFILLALPSVSAEYENIEQDWSQIVSYLEQNSLDDYVIAGITLSNPKGFNVVKSALPYYLEEAGAESPFLGGNGITVSDAEEMNGTDKPLWGVVATWHNPPLSEDSSLHVTKFQTQLNVVNVTNQKGSTLDRMISLYEKLSPWAVSPSPLCFMKWDLSNLYLVAEEFSNAADAHTEGKKLCPALSGWPTFAIYEGLLLEHASAVGDDEVFEIARKILIYDAKNIIALDSLTAFGLLGLFEQGEAQIMAGDSPEPVEKRRFTMPQNGDWGDVLFAHPPATINFNLSLPDEKMLFSSRIALAPDSWEWGGDGVTYILRIQDESGNISELYRHHVGNNPEDHKWHNVLVALGEYAGQSVTLSLITESGPAGDGTGDWAGWESPRIMWDVPE